LYGSKASYLETIFCTTKQPALFSKAVDCGNVGSNCFQTLMRGSKNVFVKLNCFNDLKKVALSLI